MPELPEVQTVVDTLSPRLTGRRVAAILHARADMVCPAGTDLTRLLPGAVVHSVTRRGKRIVITLHDQQCWFVHLGMTGRLTVEPADAPLRPHTHLRLVLDDTRELRFVDPRRFGCVVWVGRTEPAVTHDRLGPEPLRMRVPQLARRLARTRRAVKTALLDQRVVAGIGNIYADEALFAARIHPSTPADTLPLDAVRRLNAAIKRVLRRAIRHRGSSLRDYVDANGDPGAFQKLHRVYDRAAKPCRRCRTPIERIVLGQRSTHFCPKCQPVAA
jgi:formamidopyrimidine-DNA glycosylase